MLRRTPAILLCLLVCLLAAQRLSQANSTLRIDESRVRLLFGEGQARVQLEVDNDAGRAFKARATVELLSPRDAVQAAASSDIEVRRGANRVTLPFPSFVKADDREFPWYRLRYRVAPAGGEPAAEGIVSMSKAAPDLFELRVIAPRMAKRGSKLRARVRASNPVAQRPAAGVAVTGELKVDVEDEETVIKIAATTLPPVLPGTASPYPTVVTVWIAHHIPSQMLSKVPGSTRRSTIPNTRTPTDQDAMIR